MFPSHDQMSTRMSRTPTIQGTKKSSLNSSSEQATTTPTGMKHEANPATPSYVKIFPEEFDPAPKAQPEPRKPVVVETRPVHKMSAEVHSERLKIAAEIQELETNVAYCKAAKIEWLEVSKELLTYFNKGTMPSSGYYFYKDVRLCLEGTAE